MNKKTVVTCVDVANVNAILQARNSFTAAKTIPVKLDSLTAAAFFVSNFQGATALIREGVGKASMTPDDVPDFETAVDLLIQAENSADSGISREARVMTVAAILLESKKFANSGNVKAIFRHVLDEYNTASALLDVI